MRKYSKENEDYNRTTLTKIRYKYKDKEDSSIIETSERNYVSHRILDKNILNSKVQEDLSNYSFDSKNVFNTENTYHKQMISKKPFLFKKKIISSNEDNVKNIYASNLINNDIEFIRRKIESDENRERERQIFEWFYINNINISKRDLYDAFTTLIQSVFRGYSYRSQIKNYYKLRVLFNIIYKIYIKYYFRYFYDFIKYQTNNTFGYNGNTKLIDDIKELIRQNNELQQKLEIIESENNKLKIEKEKYDINGKNYKNLMDKLENIFKISEENKKLKEEINIFKNNKTKTDNKESNKIENFNISIFPNITSKYKNKDNYTIVKNININPNKQ